MTELDPFTGPVGDLLAIVRRLRAIDVAGRHGAGTRSAVDQDGWLRPVVPRSEAVPRESRGAALADSEVRPPFAGDVAEGPAAAVLGTPRGRRVQANVPDPLGGAPDRLCAELTYAGEVLRRHAEKHLIALAVQRSLLPERIPDVPGLEFAVRYEPASTWAEVGGDFYEVLSVGDRIVAAVGDVQGHSLSAAAVMAELRHAMRAFIDEGHGPKAVLCRMNSVLLRYHPDWTATVCLIRLDPSTGVLETANAGHIPPLVTGGGKAFYGRSGGVLLGCPGGAVAAQRLVVPPGGSVTLITDGLIEHRGEPMEEGLRRLRALCTSLRGDLEGCADRLLLEFAPREDDVALLMVRRHGGHRSSSSARGRSDGGKGRGDPVVRREEQPHPAAVGFPGSLP